MENWTGIAFVISIASLCLLVSFPLIWEFWKSRATMGEFCKDQEFKSYKTIITPGMHKSPLKIAHLPNWIPQESMFRIVDITIYPQKFKITGHHVFSVPDTTRHVHAVYASQYYSKIEFCIPFKFGPDYAIVVDLDSGNEAEVAIWVEK